MREKHNRKLVRGRAYALRYAVVLSRGETHLVCQVISGMTGYWSQSPIIPEQRHRNTFEQGGSSALTLRLGSVARQ